MLRVLNVFMQTITRFKFY